MTMTINGSGSVTGLTAGGLPDASVQQADLAANVAGNGPAFSAYRPAAQGIPTGAWTKVGMGTEEYDTGNCFDSTTNFRFQPNVPGYYNIVGHVMYSPASSGLGYISLYKNGTVFKYGTHASFNTFDGAWLHVVSTVFLNGSTDYVELFTFQSSGATLNITVPTAGGGNRFEGFLARSA